MTFTPPQGTMPVLAYFAPGQLDVDAAYQRDAARQQSRTLINRIARDWDWALCQPLVVARRANGRLLIVDGQHRWEAARLRGDISVLPCVVSDFSDPSAEAAAFVALNQQRRPLTRYQLHRAAVAGGDQAAVTIERLAREAGFVLTGNTGSLDQPEQLNAVAGLYAALAKHGEAAIVAVLEAMRDGFPGQAQRYFGTVSRGVLAVVLREGDRLDRGRLARALRSKDQLAWYTAAGAIATKRGVDARTAVVEAVAAAYDALGSQTVVAAAQPAARKKPPTFEEQLAKVQAGVPLVTKPVIRKADSEHTLGGIGSAML